MVILDGSVNRLAREMIFFAGNFRPEDFARPILRDEPEKGGRLAGGAVENSGQRIRRRRDAEKGGRIRDRAVGVVDEHPLDFAAAQNFARRFCVGREKQTGAAGDSVE